MACWFSLKYRLISLQRFGPDFFIWGNSHHWANIMFSNRPTHRCPTWESPWALWSGDVRRISVASRRPQKVQTAERTGLDHAQSKTGGARWSSTQLHMWSAATFCSILGRSVFWCFWALVELLGPESRSLVHSHKSSLGLAHDWGRLSFAAQPQPNSSNPARSRPVCSPEPFAAGLRASDIIPFHCHPSHLFAF